MAFALPNEKNLVSATHYGAYTNYSFNHYVIIATYAFESAFPLFGYFVQKNQHRLLIQNLPAVSSPGTR